MVFQSSPEDTPEEDYRSRFERFQTFDHERNTLVSEILNKLDTVTTQLNFAIVEKALEVRNLTADLESEREARRELQEKAKTLRENVVAMEQARFVLVLIDADPDIYHFHEKYLSRGLAGGQDAADHFMEKVREHLASVASIMEPKGIPVMVKAFANLGGLAQACVRDKKVKSVGDVTQFWIGFVRRYALVDFVDVGSGKEEADNKIREALSFYIINPQYLFGSEIRALGFRKTTAFEPLFCLPQSPMPTASTRNPQLLLLDDIKLTSSVESLETSSQMKGKPVNNSGRLRPILRNSAGKRIDKVLPVDEKLVRQVKKYNLCNWHYLRANCHFHDEKSCPRNHEYPRPLSPEEYDAQWIVARQGPCRKLLKAGNCEDDQCMYGHGST